MSRRTSADLLIGAFVAAVLGFSALIAWELRTDAREAIAAASSPAPVTTPANFPPPQPTPPPPLAAGISPRSPIKISQKEIPFPVPRIDNAAERAAFKRWWVEDFANRLELWKEPRAKASGYPNSTSIAAQLYDASEPAPGQDEAHHHELSARLKDFLAIYGTTPGSVIAWSSMHHTAPPPPAGFDIEPLEEALEVASTTAPEGFIPGKP